MKAKKMLALLVVMFFVGFFVITFSAHAQTQILLKPFGGIVSIPTECTCSFGNTWIWFIPLYLGGPVTVTGPMVYSPYFTILYGYYNIGVPGLWHLGDYVPDKGSCQMEYVYGCYELPAIGLMSKVGTNRYK